MNDTQKSQIAFRITEEIYEEYPSLWQKFGDHGRARTEEDNVHHLNHLLTAYEMKQPHFFVEYTSWLNTVLTSRNVGTHLIIDNYRRLERHLSGSVPEEQEVFFMDCLAQGKAVLQ
ncbi:hypothetical protein [Geomicrobium sp. JCM 19039]|uniref:hypothetical protein n=1 Tax=Geomicrobium sp. JCM 19039 TaxID=1460636 RepID=UPI00045F4560|nr:hypothetical protein [Geomicrobium sp. JCM 19039]GAK12647.1 hypothetical protein JCM19039_2439 [Geomicrobium sp. JCM 19039]